MRPGRAAITLALVGVLVTAALAAAQEPVRSFDQLDTRLKPGDTIWVTDAQGREVKGKVTALRADALLMDAGGARTFSGADVRLVVERRQDSLANGALIGFGVVGTTVGLSCYASMSGSDRDWCPLVAVFYGGVGMAVGIGIDALKPGKKTVVYRAPGAGGSNGARLSIRPFIAPRAKGVAVSVRF